MVNKRFSIEITSYTFVGSGEEIYGRLSPLYLVMDLKSLQVNINTWKEKLRCEVEESPRQIGTHLQEAHENWNLRVSIITSNLNDMEDLQKQMPFFMKLSACLAQDSEKL